MIMSLLISSFFLASLASAITIFDENTFRDMVRLQLAETKSKDVVFALLVSDRHCDGFWMDRLKIVNSAFKFDMSNVHVTRMRHMSISMAQLPGQSENSTRLQFQFQVFHSNWIASGFLEWQHCFLLCLHSLMIIVPTPSCIHIDHFSASLLFVCLPNAYFHTFF